jgi:adenosylcobinamide-GDP ribazoletransferase
MSDRSDSDDIDFGPAAWWKDFALAAMFLTRLRLPMRESAGMAALQRASRMFAVVGLLVGLAGGIVYAIAFGLGFSSWLAAAFAVGATILLTGGLHEDGLADMADGFAGGGTREEKLAIMRDSRIGSFGTLALIFSVLSRVAALASLADIGLVIAALIAGHAASRAAMTAVMHALPNSRSDGLSAAAGRPDRIAAGIGLVVAAIAALLLLQGAGLLAIIIAAGAASAIAWLAQRQIGGQTGDVLGATEQIAQAAFLAGLTLAI